MTVPAYRDLLGLASLMLAYPDEVVCGSRAEVIAALEPLPGSTAKAELAEFGAWWAGRDPEGLREEYVATFDMRRGAALYVTYLTYQDSRSRGMALYDLKQVYREAGYAPDPGELPDYLPTVCQFAALADAPAGATALRLAADGVRAIHAALVAQSSRYALVLAAIGAIIEKGVA